MREKIIKTLKLFLLAFMGIQFFYCSNKDETVLAKVGNLEINGSEYMERFKTVREKLSLPDNGEARMNFLNSFIDEQLLLNEAENLGYNKDTAAVEKLNTIKLQKLLDLYLEKEVYDHINVSDNDLKNHFAKMNIKLKLRHLYADNKKTADSLCFLVENGVSFEKLAKEVFNDPRLKETGGDLGYMGFDEMQMDFADVAYKMEIGEISKPVKTNYGYSVIKVDDRLGNPFLTDTEFLKQKSAILTSYYKYAKKRAAKDHANKLENEVQINDDVFNELFSQFKSGLSRNDIESVSQKSTVPDQAILLSSGLGTWDVGTFRKKAKFTSKSQRNWIRHKENFREFVLGLVAREQVVQLARAKGYDESDEYSLTVNKDFNYYLIDRLKEDVLNSIKMPNDSLTRFYNKNRGAFIDPGKANLREIVLDNPAIVKQVKELLDSGKSFTELAKEYSINKHTAIFGGEMGFVNYHEIGSFATEVKKLKPGDWIGPLKRGRVNFFLQCIEQQDSRLKTFEEAKEEIISKYRTMHFELAMQDKINEIKTRTEIVAYPQKLRDLKYN